MWRSMYTYCDIENLEVSYGSYYFESDIKDFKTNKKVVLEAVYYLHYEYDIPLEAFKFKFTNKSIWVEIIPSVMGISPSYYLNEIFKSITAELNRHVGKRLGINNPFDMQVYSPRQLSRVVGSYLKESNRYVIELTFSELESFSYFQITRKAQYRRKLTYPDNAEFYASDAAKEMFNNYRNLVCRRNKSNFTLHDDKISKACIRSIKNNGVEEGKRNIAFFYTTIAMRNKGLSIKEWEKEAPSYIENYDSNGLDNISQMKATIKSAYKSKYKFSCNKMRMIMPEHCNCESCPYNKGFANSIIINRSQLKLLLDKKATLRYYKALLNYHFKKISKKDLNLLLELSLIDEKSELKKEYKTGSFVEISKDFYCYVEKMGAELILFLQALNSSNNGVHLNPRMTTKHYSNKLKKSLRTIQRQFKALTDAGFINGKSFCFQPKESRKLVEEIEEFILQNKDEKADISKPLNAVFETKKGVISKSRGVSFRDTS